MKTKQGKQTVSEVKKFEPRAHRTIDQRHPEPKAHYLAWKLDFQQELFDPPCNPNHTSPSIDSGEYDVDSSRAAQPSWAKKAF
ncbi:hypothetical protein PM082_023663 [Marasmius tenuissimus]|nr:hypothetical protein PM082_023663 [Marasmius tenuissimus]